MIFEGETLRQLVPHIIIILGLSCIDFLTIVGAHFVKIVKVSPQSETYDDFSILIPIFGNVTYLKNVEFLKAYGSRVILCTTTKESQAFDRALTDISERYGFKIFRSEVVLASATHRPNPWKLFQGTLHGGREVGAGDNVEVKINKEIARDEIIKDSFEAVTTKYCIFLDGDTVAHEDLRKLVATVQKYDYDLCSVRILASQTKTLMEKLQSVEYSLAMDARRLYPWLTSGACMVSKTEVMKSIMAHHSLFFSGGDIEIGKLAKMMKYRVGHVSFNFYTDVPQTFRAWFKQRMAWFGGGFRHAIVNLHQYTWRHPIFYFYTTVLVFLLLPLRWYEVIMYPELLLFVIVLYWLLIAIFHFRQLRWYYALFPFYALIQVMVLVPCGIYTYFRMAHSASNLGFIKLRVPKA